MMKLLPIVVLLSSKGTRAARLSLEEEESGSTTNICATDFQRHLHCSPPGEAPTEDFSKEYYVPVQWHFSWWAPWAWTTGGYHASAHATCDVECCPAPGQKRTGNLCRCLHIGEVFTDHKMPPGEYPGSNFCCSLTARDNSVCGCASAGTVLGQHGAQEGDCCSGVWDSTQTCVSKVCVRSGVAPDGESCCRHEVHPDGEHLQFLFIDQHDGKCGCFHGGQKPTDNDMWEGSDCCSGSFDVNTRRCTFIADAETELLNGANAQDCESGQTKETDGKLYCKAPTCTSVGGSLHGGHHCCSGVKVDTDGGDEVCGCVAAGSAVPPDQTGVVCCSGHATDGTCDLVDAGDILPIFASSKDCGDGVVHTDNITTCACYKPGSNLKLNHKSQPGQCCSTKTTEGGETCACVENGHMIARGATAGHCCSSLSHEGYCSCGWPGYPSGQDGQDCCSKTSVKGNCGCLKPGVNTTRVRNCCGGHTVGDHIGVLLSGEHQCACIPDGVVVAPYVTKEACCSLEKSGYTCGASAEAA